MQILRILSTAALALGVVSASSYGSDDSTQLAGGNAACGAARVRKPWESLTTQEQSLYIEAVGLAIKNGVAKDFAAMHLETMGETQAHHSCGFFAWHRRMLLAFESYLRDLDPKFKCLTIPYYDVHTAYVNAANKKCANMFECSPIFAALGGAATSEQEKLLFNGQETNGFQVKGAPFTVECDDNKEQCGCMLRNNLQKRSVPSGAGFSTFLDIVTRSKDYATFLENIQFGIHNEVHNAVGGVMSTFASPRDVFFYSWHGAIDMYLTVFHQCQLGTALTEEQLKTSLQAFTAATQTCGGISGVGADSAIVMNIKVDGQLVEASQHPTLGKYFAEVGDQMWNYGDTTRLSDYSYTYELPAIIKTQILSNKDICKGLDNNNSNTPAPTTPTPTTQAPTADGSEGSNDSNATVTMPPTMGTNNGTGLPTVAPHSGIIVVNETDGSSATKSPSYGYGFDDYNDDSGSVDATNAVSGLTPSAATTGDYWKWIQTTYDGLVSRFNGDMAVVAEQMRVIECLAFDNVFGVVEFSDDFVKNFHLASSQPVCGKKIDAVTSGNVTIAVAVPATDFKAEQVKFAAPEVIETVKQEAAKAPVVEAPLIAPSYVSTAEKVLQDAQATASTNDNSKASLESGSVRSANDDGSDNKPATGVLLGSAGDAAKTTTTTTTTGDKKKKHKLCHE